MATVELGRAHMALVSDLAGTWLALPRVRAYTPTRKLDRTFQRFHGDVLPTGFRGQGRTVTVPLTSRYMSGEHQLGADLLALFRLAETDADGRILFRSHLGEVAGLNLVEAVLITDESQDWSIGGGVLDISFTAQAVAYSPEV